MSDVDALLQDLAASVQGVIREDRAAPPDAPRSWVELQGAAVALGARCEPADRRRLARALANAILEQESIGPSNRLEPSTFAFLYENLGAELTDLMEATPRGRMGGPRYLQQHMWGVPGPAGADWLRRFVLHDDLRANTLCVDMGLGRVPSWSDEEWPARLDVLATLPSDPRPTIVRSLTSIEVPRVAAPALTRVALHHGVDERDHLVRTVCTQVRGRRTGDVDVDLELFDWAAGTGRPELFTWILELSGEAGERAPLVAAAERHGHITPDDATTLSAVLDRPAWADGPVSWVVDRVETIGQVELPSRQISGGDPWSILGGDRLPWVVELTSNLVEVQVVVADHPLIGQQNAALVASISNRPVERWQLVRSAGQNSDGYHVEVGIAGFGSPEAYDSKTAPDHTLGDLYDAPPRWQAVVIPGSGGMALCTVGPQHQLCRTWVGLGSDGVVAQLVTDLGLLDLDPERPATSLVDQIAPDR